MRREMTGGNHTRETDDDCRVGEEGLRLVPRVKTLPSETTGRLNREMPGLKLWVYPCR